MLEALKQAGVNHLTLLDIGGGVGVIQHELLKAGVSHSTHVDASSAYLKTSQNEAARLGYADQTSYHHGDFVALAQEVAPADIVTLDRVICCYHDMPALVSLSAHKIGGPQCVGALIVREETPLAPLVRGGPQERRRRAGTENVAGDGDMPLFIIIRELEYT